MTEIRLQPMSESDFEAYTGRAIKDYGEENVQSGRWSGEEAFEQASNQFQE